MTLAVRETLTIREETPADRAAMLDLWVEAWSRTRPDIDFAARRGWLNERLDAMKAGAVQVFVYVDEQDRPLGFATVDLVSGDMDQLVTALAAQGRGVGSALIEHAKLMSPSGLSLTVNTFNTAAIHLYQRAGFVTIAEGVSTGSGLPVWHMRWPERIPVEPEKGCHG